MTLRSRVEDLGRVSEQLRLAINELRELTLFMKATAPNFTEEDREMTNRRISDVWMYVDEAFHIARFGDDEE